MNEKEPLFTATISKYYDIFEASKEQVEQLARPKNPETALSSSKNTSFTEELLRTDANFFN